MDDARSKRQSAEDSEARQQQALSDAESADRDAEQAQSEADGYALEADGQRSQASTLDPDSAEARILEGNATDNDTRQREAMSSVQASQSQAAELRGQAASYGEEVSRYNAEADSAEDAARQEEEDDKDHDRKMDIARNAARVIDRLDN